jgi:uncharacterized protein (DUF1800 family)
MRPRFSALAVPALCTALLSLAACAERQSGSPSASVPARPVSLAAGTSDLALVNRLSWGETADGRTLNGLSAKTWLEQQLNPPSDDGLPPQVQAQIAAMEISQKSLTELNDDIRGLREQAQAVKGTPDYDAAQKTYQQKLNQLAQEAQTRSLLRDLYSRNQLKEQLTWFWFNHFNVHAPKGEIRAFVGDYEETIRAHALGKFGELLTATALHPAMLQYLDNAQNAVGHINENYAREIMELHTLGVGSGYTQQDVQELARILTGLGVNLSGKPPGGKPKRGDFRAKDLTLFNPNRHDFGDKTFLGTAIKGDGMDEIGKAIAILVIEPPTAHYVSRQLAQYFCCDAPSSALVNAMAATWTRSGGDIAEVLKTLFASREFTASLGKKFKDPVHYAVSAVRAVYGPQAAVTNAMPLVNWLNRMGEPLYGHETPDGYALIESAWSGPGEMATRFEFARQMGSGARNMFSPPDAPPQPAPPPVLQQTSYYTAVTPALSAATTKAIAQGANQADRNMLFLASPEFMRR